MREELKNLFQDIFRQDADAYALVYGSKAYPDLKGNVWFYHAWNGTLVLAEVMGLPKGQGVCGGKIFGFHIHEGSSCTGNSNDPFADTKGHYNPGNCQHPEHAGDLPPLFGNDGYALSMFYTDRFVPEEAEGHTVVIHDMPDDFHTQPSGDSGMKIACGEIIMNE